MNKIFFFEDEYCQIEILLQENYTFCVNQMIKIKKVSENHSQDLGYSDVMFRENYPYEIINKKIQVSELEERFESANFERQTVYSEYSNFLTPSDTVFAFGINSDIAVFYEADDGFVSKLWLRLNIREENDIEGANRFLQGMTEIGEFILVDWVSLYVEHISNIEYIYEYLNRHKQIFTKLERHWK
jgi:hypothetical protein